MTADDLARELKFELHAAHARIKVLEAEVLRFMELYDAARGDVVTLEGYLDEAAAILRAAGALQARFDAAQATTLP